MSDDVQNVVSPYLIEADRKGFEKGIVSGAYRAAVHCLLAGQPVPQWAVPSAVEALQRAFDGRDGRGKGNAAPRVVSERARIKDQVRREVDGVLDWGGISSKSEAFKIVADMFNRYRNDGKLWTPEMIKAAYYRGS